MQPIGNEHYYEVNMEKNRQYFGKEYLVELVHTDKKLWVTISL